MIEKIGQKYQRKYGDRQVVELVKVIESVIEGDEDCLMITDYNGVHFISPAQLETHFDRYEGQAIYPKPKSTTTYKIEPTKKIKRDHFSGALIKQKDKNAN